MDILRQDGGGMPRWQLVMDPYSGFLFSSLFSPSSGLLFLVDFGAGEAVAELLIKKKL